MKSTAFINKQYENNMTRSESQSVNGLGFRSAQERSYLIDHCKSLESKLKDIQYSLRYAFIEIRNIPM